MKIIQTIKTKNKMPKVKDKVHSDYVHQLIANKKRITEIQKWIKFEKELIAMYMKMDRDGVDVDYKRLKMLREENKFLSEANKTLRDKIKSHQRDMVVIDQNMTFRMYSMVLRQLNPMQKGIQSLHAVAEYGQMVKNGDCTKETRDAYNTWANRDKAMIVLDAGVSNDLVDACVFLKENNIPFKVFHEPDLYGCMTAVSFLADERVFDVKTYPSYEDYISDWNIKVAFNTTTGKILPPPTQDEWIAKVFHGADPEPIMKMREFIFSKKLSM